ncbi:MAG: ABC transporter permease [Verrucomicrobia bacterium]|nr:ABC transporter permease [Verrucomicrobiota bacterium]
MSRLPFELMLALRYLRPKRTFVSIITLISIVGVTLGVGVLIIVTSVMSGFNRLTKERILGFQAHLKIYDASVPLADYERIIGVVGSNHLVKGVAPFVMGKVLVETQPEAGSPAVDAPVLRGIDPERERRVSVVPEKIVSGSYDVKGNGLLVGSAFADMLKLRVGDRVSIHSPRNLQKMRDSKQAGQDELSVPDEYTVRGIFDVGYYEFNALVVVTSLANAQDMYELGDSVHGLQVMLHDADEAERAKMELERTLGPNFVIRTWMQDNSSLLGAVAVEKNLMIFLLFFIMIVAAFGITSVMITFVVQKTREIGILKALGATRQQVTAVFLLQSIPVGLLGVTFGYLLGRLALAYRNEFLAFLRHAMSIEIFPASIYNLPELPAVIIPGDVAVICGGSLVICVLAGVLPALNAGRLQPVEALRHE